MESSEFFVDVHYLTAGTDYFSPEKEVSGEQSSEHFSVDDLLDFPNDDVLPTAGNSNDSSAVTVVACCNRSVSGSEIQFSGNVSQLTGDLPELEWLSNFVEDSFSAVNEFQSLRFLPESSSGGTRPVTITPNTPAYNPETKTRSKRSRAAAACDWATRLLHSSPPPPPPDYSCRKCSHCATVKTPQWRTGPIGPKTLCNACGVRYKKGRLVPEYRPASSPSFVPARHSNSHRKVMELRRQKEFQASLHHPPLTTQSSIFSRSDCGNHILNLHYCGTNFDL